MSCSVEVQPLLQIPSTSCLQSMSDTRCDMRSPLASSEPEARIAVDYFVYSAVAEIGALAAMLGGAGGLVLGAGIGDSSAEIGRHISESCACLGPALRVGRSAS